MEEQRGQKVGQRPSGKDGQTAADLGLLQNREGVPTATYVEMQTSKKAMAAQVTRLPASNALGYPGPRTNRGDLTGSYSLMLKD